MMLQKKSIHEIYSAAIKPIQALAGESPLIGCASEPGWYELFLELKFGDFASNSPTPIQVLSSLY